MLSEEQREHLRNYEENYKKAENKVEFDAFRQMNKRIREKALEAIKDLTLIAETMPEQQKEKIFTKELLRDFIKFTLRPGDRKPFGFDITDIERKANLPEPIYNKRIFDLGVLLAGFGINSAYHEISWKQRIRDINKQLSKGEMWNIINSMDAYGYLLEK